MDDLAFLLGAGYSEAEARGAIRALAMAQQASGRGRPEMAKLSTDQLAEYVEVRHMPAVAALLAAG